MSGVTKDGIEIERLSEIISDISTDITNTFGDDTRVDANSVFGLIVGIFSRLEAENWELIEQAYNSRTLNGAIGNQLDAIGQIIGTERKELVLGYGTVQISGTDGVIVPRDTRYQDDQGRVWIQKEEAELLAITEVEVTALNEGEFIAGAGTITIIVDAVSGLDSVINNTPTTAGKPEENDAKYRVRLSITAQGAGLGTYDSLYFSLYELDGVSYVGIAENFTDTIDADGLAPHSFSAVVQGGDDNEIADTIWKNKPAGIQTNGAVSVGIIDAGGLPHTVNFERPTLVPIFIEVEIKTSDGWDSSYEEQMKEAIVNYGSLEFTVGDDVIQSKLYIPTNTIPSQSTTSILIGTSAAPTTSDDIAISHFQLSEFSTANIGVTIV